MMKYNNTKSKKISNTIFIVPILTLIITAISIISIAAFSIYNMKQNNENLISKKFMQNLQSTTKQRVLLTYNIIDSLYKFEKNKKQTIKIMQKVLGKMRWDKKGYIFVFDYHGNTLYHPNHHYMTINRWNFERHGIKVIRQLILQALKNPKKGTYVKYLAYNPKGKPIEKISYVKIYQPLKIVIGNGVYLDYLNKKLLTSQKEYQDLAKNIFKQMIIATITILLIIMILTYFISKKVQLIFDDYIKYLEKEKEKLFMKAYRDSLTGLYNREYLKMRFPKLIKECKKFAILFVDLDYFKEINDSYGHEIGDIALKEIAKRLKLNIDENECVVRFGGDEFVIISKTNDKDKLSQKAQTIINVLKEKIIIDNRAYFLSASCGISLFPNDGNNKNTLIKYADSAMYEAKKKGKDRVEFYQAEMTLKAQQRLQIRNNLKKALKNNEFIIYYQPQIDTKNNLSGFECLIRWKHPQNGLIFPNDFIPIAVEMGIIDDIDLWVMENAMIQYNKWLEKGYKPGNMSCNLTVYQLEKGNFYEKIMAIIKKQNFDISNLSIEITEEGIMKNPQKSINILNQLVKEGIKINIDDFGTGYSSLAYLEKLPLAKLKIDRAFVKDIGTKQENTIIVKTIINLAKNLNLKLIAEGVEDKVQRDFIFNGGVDYIQGYYYSKPINSDEFEEKFLK